MSRLLPLVLLLGAGIAAAQEPGHVRHPLLAAQPAIHPSSGSIAAGRPKRGGPWRAAVAACRSASAASSRSPLASSTRAWRWSGVTTSSGVSRVRSAAGRSAVSTLTMLMRAARRSMVCLRRSSLLYDALVMRRASSPG